MPIQKFELTSIEGKRFTALTEKHRNIRIDHNSSVTLVTQTSDDEVSVDFRFTANYTGIGLIKIEGKFVFQGGEAQEFVKTWNDSGQMPPVIASEVHTAIMSNCIPEAMFIARDIRLPPPVPLPKINVGQQKKEGESDGKPSGYA